LSACPLYTLHRIRQFIERIVLLDFIHLLVSRQFMHTMKGREGKGREQKGYEGKGRAEQSRAPLSYCY
jgi:hypothetical protein